MFRQWNFHKQTELQKKKKNEKYIKTCTISWIPLHIKLSFSGTLHCDGVSKLTRWKYRMLELDVGVAVFSYYLLKYMLWIYLVCLARTSNISRPLCAFAQDLVTGRDETEPSVSAKPTVYLCWSPSRIRLAKPSPSPLLSREKVQFWTKYSLPSLFITSH